MAANDGSMTNETRFWRLFLSAFGGSAADHSAEFDRFIKTNSPGLPMWWNQRRWPIGQCSC